MWCCRGYVGFVVVVVFLFLYLSSPALVVVGPWAIMYVIFVALVIGSWALLYNHFGSLLTRLSVKGFYCFHFQ